MIVNGIENWKVGMGGERVWGSREERMATVGKLKGYFNNIGKR